MKPELLNCCCNCGEETDKLAPNGAPECPKCRDIRWAGSDPLMDEREQCAREDAEWEARQAKADEEADRLNPYVPEDEI